MNDTELLAAFDDRRAERLQKGWGTYAPRNPIASDIHDCRRYMVMRQVAWQVRPHPDVEGLETIENGNVKEGPMIRQLQDEGWEVVEQQVPFEIRQPLEDGGPRVLIVRGNLDGKIRIERERIPFDTKDTSEYVLRAVDDQKDLLLSPWTRKWWRQIQMYLLGEENERGLLLLGFRGKRKPILVHLDYGAAEKMLQLCTWTVRTVAALEEDGVDHETVDAALNALDEPYHHEQNVCRMCPFHQRACFPPDKQVAASQIRPDLAKDVARYMEVKPLASEYERLKRRVKAETEGFPETIAGDFVIDGGVKTRRMKAKEAVAEHVQEYWGFDVRPVGELK